MTARPQPVREYTGLDYGENKRLNDAQKALPLPNNQPTSGAASPQGQPVSRPNVFGPTERPNEALTAGAALGAGPPQRGMLPDDGLDALRAMVMNGFDTTGAVRRMLEREANRSA